MKFDDLTALTSELDVFDLATLAQLCGGRRATILVQLHRWIRSGKLIALRRGMYALADPYRKRPIQPAKLANELHTPSYLSGVWALSFYGLIPEMAVEYTCVTPKNPRTFDNAFGTFVYSHVKQEYFFGYQRLEVNGKFVRIAAPEKALLDHWHLNSGEWTCARLAEMRYQNRDHVDVDRLKAFAARFGKPRLSMAVQRWIELTETDEEGTTIL